MAPNCKKRLASMVTGHPERRRKYKKITISGFKIFLLKQTNKQKNLTMK